jgi:hypothetical protein
VPGPWPGGGAYGTGGGAYGPGGGTPGGVYGPGGGAYGTGGGAPGGVYGPGGGAYGPGGGAPGGPQRPKRGFLIVGGLVVVFIAVIAVFALKGSPSASVPTPTPSPTPSPTLSTAPVGTVESLNQIINPRGQSPIGTHCQLAGLAKLSAATVTHRLKCDTTVSSLYVWAYQFDSAADYQQGFTHLQNYLVFKPSSAGSNCPPTGGSITGATNWRSSSNPKYHSYTGQHLDCLTIHGTYGTEVTYLWTLPSQHVVFLAQSWNTHITFRTLDNWWSHLSYG